MKQSIFEKDKKPIVPHVHFPLGTVSASTFLINHSLRIEWAKADWRDRLSRSIAAEWNGNETATFFDILLHASLKELFFNWQPLFSFVYGFLQQSTPAELFNRFAPTVSIGLPEIKHPVPPLSEFKKVGRIDSCLLQVEDDSGKMQSKRLYGVVLSEGTVFILKNEMGEPSNNNSSVNLPKAPGRSPFSVLSAQLDHSESIVDTLLPETYYQLIKRIWEESDRVSATFDGHRARRNGAEMQYLIAENRQSDPVYDAIRCAILLRKKMREIEVNLKADVGWYSRIRLNIGISSGKDHLEKDDPTASMAFMLPGGAADQAHYLSTIAQNGAIWITKSALSRVTPALRKRITFGLYQKNGLIPNIFAQISDLRHAGGVSTERKEIHPIPVTRIISLRTT